MPFIIREPFIHDFWYVIEGIVSFLAVTFALFEYIQKRKAILKANVGFNDPTIIAELYSEYYLMTRCLSIIRVIPLLRLINEFRSVRIVLTSIYQSFAYIGHLCVVVLCVWYVWASIGVELFGGILRQPEIVEGELTTDYVSSGAYTRSWTRNYNISQPKNGKPASIELGGIASYDKVSIKEGNSSFCVFSFLCFFIFVFFYFFLVIFFNCFFFMMFLFS